MRAESTPALSQSPEQRIHFEKMPNLKALRLFLLDDGSAVGVFARASSSAGGGGGGGGDPERPDPASWARTVVLEPSGACFSVCDAREGLGEDGGGGSRTNMHHHLTQYCASDLLPHVSQILAFRNAYAPAPVLVWHAPTRAFLGVSVHLAGAADAVAVSSSALAGAAPRRVHWPAAIGPTWCDMPRLGHDVGAVRVRSVDGLAELVLADHGQMCRVTFPVATLAARHESTAATTTATATSRQHAVVTQLIWVPQCPDHFAHPLALAQELRARLVRRTAPGSIQLKLDLDFSSGGRDTRVAGIDTTGAVVEGTLPQPPTTCATPTRPAWPTAVDIDRTGLAAESALLCLPLQDASEQTAIGAPPNHHMLPLSEDRDHGGRTRRVSVEWAPQETYWNAVDGSAAGSFLLCGGAAESGGDKNHLNLHTFMSCSIAGYVRTYRPRPVTHAPLPLSTAEGSTLSTVVVVTTSDAHVPDVRERHAVRHMRAHLAHAATARLARQRSVTGENGDFQNAPSPSAVLPSCVPIAPHDTARKVPPAPSTKPRLGTGSSLLEEVNLAGTGRFCCYRDGRIRCVYEDRTIVRVGNGVQRQRHSSIHPGASSPFLPGASSPRPRSRWDWSGAAAEVVRPDGTCETVLCGNAVGDGVLFYVRTAVEFGTWAMASPEERAETVAEEQRYYHLVHGEANRIRRFLACVGLEREGKAAAVTAGQKQKQQSRPMAAVEGGNSPVPSRAVLSALAKQAVQNTSAFVESM